MPQIKKEKKSEVKEAKYKSIEEQRKEHRKLYDTVYREYSGTRYLLNMPQTVYEIDENGLIVAKNLCDGPLGIEDVLYISALDMEQPVRKYKAPDTLCKIYYDTIFCHIIGSSIEFSDHPETQLSVDQIDFSTLLKAYNQIKIGKYMHRDNLKLRLEYFSCIDRESIAESHIIGVRFKKIFESAIELITDDDTASITNSFFGIIDFTNIQRIDNSIKVIFQECDIETLKISDVLMNSNITIAENCHIKNLEIQVSSIVQENMVVKFKNVQIDKLVYSTPEVPSNTFNACKFEEISLYKDEMLSERKTKGMLSDTKLHYIQEGAFNNCEFNQFEIVTENCHPKAFIQPIIKSLSYLYTQNYREVENILFENPKVFSVLRIFPYDIKLIKLGQGEKELYFEAEKLSYKLDKALKSTDFYE